MLSMASDAGMEVSAIPSSTVGTKAASGRGRSSPDRRLLYDGVGFGVGAACPSKPLWGFGPRFLHELEGTT